MPTPCLQLAIVAFTAIASGCATSAVDNLSGEDLAEMKRAAMAYSEAWLSNDSEAVMATFVSEPVLSPSGMQFLEGQTAAREFWWPADSPPTVVTHFESEELEAGGSGNIGYVRGLYTLHFEYDGSSDKNFGKYLQLLERVPGGGWRISHHFWNDLPSDEEN